MSESGSPSLAIRLDYGRALVGDRQGARGVAEILVRPCFIELVRLAARRKDRWSKHVEPSTEPMAEYLTDASNDAISMDIKRGAEIGASAEVENGVEWGTFLGPGHLARLDLSELRASGALAQVVEVTPQLAYLQVSEDPADDLTEGFEGELQAARRALAPVLIDVSGDLARVAAASPASCRDPDSARRSRAHSSTSIPSIPQDRASRPARAASRAPPRAGRPARSQPGTDPDLGTSSMQRRGAGWSLRTGGRGRATAPGGCRARSASAGKPCVVSARGLRPAILCRPPPTHR